MNGMKTSQTQETSRELVHESEAFTVTLIIKNDTVVVPNEDFHYGILTYPGHFGEEGNIVCMRRSLLAACKRRRISGCRFSSPLCSQATRTESIPLATQAMTDNSY